MLTVEKFDLYSTFEGEVKCNSKRCRCVAKRLHPIDLMWPGPLEASGLLFLTTFRLVGM